MNCGKTNSNLWNKLWGLLTRLPSQPIINSPNLNKQTNVIRNM